MITYLRGQLTDISSDPPRVVVLTSGGVGYLVNLPVYVFDRLNQRKASVGEEIELHIFYSVSERQPLPLLVGFLRTEDRAFFELFLQVEGIGPAKAAAALTVPVADIARAIETEDTVTLVSLPGIGSRAAQKILATLRGKVASVAALSDDGMASMPGHPSDARTDVIGVLVDLGYRNAEAQRLVLEAIRNHPDAIDDSQELLQHVFRSTASATDDANTVS